MIAKVDILNPDIMQMVISQGIFGALFVWLLIDTRKESKTREQQLLEQIDTQNQAQSRIVQAIERLEQKINNLID